MFWGHVWNSRVTIWIHTTSGMMNHLCNSSSAFQNEKCKINKIHRAVFGPSDPDDSYRLSALLFKHARRISITCNSTSVGWLRHKCFPFIIYCSNNTESLSWFQSHTNKKKKKKIFFFLNAVAWTTKAMNGKRKQMGKKPKTAGVP